MHAPALKHASGLYHRNECINELCFTECSETEGNESAQAEEAVSVCVIIKHTGFMFFSSSSVFLFTLTVTMCKVHFYNKLKKNKKKRPLRQIS